MDLEARAAAPILEVGAAGQHGHVKLIESEVIARYLEDAFPKPPMQPIDAAQKALGNMFVMTFMELVQKPYMMCLAAKSQETVDSAMVGIRRGLFALERGLAKYSTGAGPFFNGNDLGIVEALTGPFVIRMLVNLKHHRNVDILAMEEVPRATLWMKAIRDHPAVINTTPADKSLQAVPPYLEPFFKAECSLASKMATPSSPENAEAAFAATIDAGLVHKGRSPRDRSNLSQPEPHHLAKL